MHYSLTLAPCISIWVFPINHSWWIFASFFFSGKLNIVKQLISNVILAASAISNADLGNCWKFLLPISFANWFQSTLIALILYYEVFIETAQVIGS